MKKVHFVSYYMCMYVCHNARFKNVKEKAITLLCTNLLYSQSIPLSLETVSVTKVNNQSNTTTFSRCKQSNTTRQILIKTQYLGDMFRLIL
jgi:hypothetical protein